MTTTTDATTCEAFARWLEAAQPGDRCCYFRGLSLASDARARMSVAALRDAVQSAAGLNTRTLTEQRPGKALIRGLNGYFLDDQPRLVDLAQRRPEDGKFIEYLAIARRNHAPVKRRTTND